MTNFISIALGIVTLGLSTFSFALSPLPPAPELAPYERAFPCSHPNSGPHGSAYPDTVSTIYLSAKGDQIATRTEGDLPSEPTTLSLRTGIIDVAGKTLLPPQAGGALFPYANALGRISLAIRGSLTGQTPLYSCANFNAADPGAQALETAVHALTQSVTTLFTLDPHNFRLDRQCEEGSEAILVRTTSEWVSLDVKKNPEAGTSTANYILFSSGDLQANYAANTGDADGGWYRFPKGDARPYLGAMKRFQALLREVRAGNSCTPEALPLDEALGEVARLIELAENLGNPDADI